FAMTTRGKRLMSDVSFEPGDVFVFGRETAGLSDAQRALFAQQQWIRLPMRAGQRSLNLSNTVAIVAYEAWRQQGYADGQ
ncbi:MAG TPA: TrmH family RNA methyltransferase, partial [Orrella sp.]